MNITIATSIAPHNIDLQKKAISSWLELGFTVKSVNSGKEIVQIKDHFPEVIFEETTRDASPLTGKPFVFFDDILEVLSTSGSHVCAIINSDIYLDTDLKFQDFISQEVAGGLVFGNRIDVHSISILAGQEYFGGFDYFFFSRDLLTELHKTDFCLGVPWWDYWVPLFTTLKGLSAKHLVTPIAYHLKHPTRWNMDYLRAFGDKLIGYLMEPDLRTHLDEHLKTRIDFSKNNSDYTILALSILNFIYQETEKIFYLTANDVPRGDDLNCDRCRLNELKVQYYQGREKQVVDHLEKKLMEIRTSLSWKITAPLRTIYDKMRKPKTYFQDPENIEH